MKKIIEHFGGKVQKFKRTIEIKKKKTPKHNVKHIKKSAPNNTLKPSTDSRQSQGHSKPSPYGLYKFSSRPTTIKLHSLTTCKTRPPIEATPKVVRATFVRVTCMVCLYRLDVPFEKILRKGTLERSFRVDRNIKYNTASPRTPIAYRWRKTAVLRYPCTVDSSQRLRLGAVQTSFYILGLFLLLLCTLFVSSLYTIIISLHYTVYQITTRRRILR